eukprot:TRINITY_DN3312_c0_g2_i1.p1 TRINITY_DN3312_c0_g2~~TRINITY_DN3312_c0_g2_i1.p1  ORF type:complete len:404 (+),score=79.89 TRINITY_DN3312_c0_g2_i1:32-1213(+)
MNMKEEIFQIRNRINQMLSWRINEEDVVTIDECLQSHMNTCDYSSNGQCYVISSEKGPVMIFNSKTDSVVKCLNDHLKDISHVIFSSDSCFMVSCSYDHTLVIYDVENDFSIVNKIYRNDCVLSVCFSPCSKYLYLGDDMGRIEKYDVFNQDTIYHKKLHDSSIWTLEVSSNGKDLISGCDDYRIAICNSVDLSNERFLSLKSVIYCCACHPVEEICAMGQDPDIVTILSLNDASILQNIKLGGLVFDLKYITMCSLLVMSGDGFLTIFDTNTYQQIQRVYCGCDRLNFSFCVSPDNIKLISGRCDTDKVKIYSLIPFATDSSLLELSKLAENNGYVIFCLVSIGVESSLIRKLVASGIRMNLDDYNLGINLVWDLVDMNELNGGNLHNLMPQ